MDLRTQHLINIAKNKKESEIFVKDTSLNLNLTNHNILNSKIAVHFKNENIVDNINKFISECDNIEVVNSINWLNTEINKILPDNNISKYIAVKLKTKMNLIQQSFINILKTQNANELLLLNIAKSL